MNDVDVTGAILLKWFSAGAMFTGKKDGNHYQILDLEQLEQLTELQSGNGSLKFIQN